MLNFAGNLSQLEDNYNVLKANDIQCVADWMAHNFGPWNARIVKDKDGDQAARFSRVDVDRITLATYRWNIGVQSQIMAGEDVLFIAIPLSGQVKMSIEGVGDIEPGEKQARVYRRDVPHTNAVSPGYANMSLIVPLELIERRARSYYGNFSDDPIKFSPLLDLGGAAGGAILGLVKHVAHSLVFHPEIYDNPNVKATLTDLVATQVLTSLEHNYSQGRAARPTGAVPRIVRQAEEYMRAHAQDPISVEDLAKAAGCSERTLHEAFRKFRSQTPMTTLRSVRLEGARRDLQAASGTVTEIAFKWGFANLGRFAQFYARQFGENPSNTIRVTTIRNQTLMQS